MPESDPFEAIRQELRRGTVIMAVLAQLRTEHYGYALRKALGERGLEIDENTLYPLLRRLETQGLLVSEWRDEDKRARRFYRVSPAGTDVLARLRTEWQDLAAALARIDPPGAPDQETPDGPA